MADSPLHEELEQLIESSFSFAMLKDEDKALVKERLLELPKDEMERVAGILRKEQKDQFKAMKGLVDKIEDASRELTKTFLTEREKEETKADDKQAQSLMDELHNM